jgi:single-strand DNA-binding protein
MVGVDGELRQDRWQQQDGQNRSKVEIVANYLQLLGGSPGASGGGSGGGGNNGGSGFPERQGGSPSAAPSSSPPPDDGFADDIPF